MLSMLPSLYLFKKLQQYSSQSVVSLNILDVHKKIEISDPPFFYNHPKLVLSPLPPWTSLAGIRCSPGKWSFGIFFGNFNNKINRLTYCSFSFRNTHSIYNSHKYNKTGKKSNRPEPNRFL